MKRFTAFFAPIFKNLWQTTPPDCCREQTGKIKKFSLRLPKRPLFTVVVVNSGQNTPPQSLYWWSKPVYLSEVKEKYDYILIDCMPSLGMVTINALSAADSVIIPVQAQYLPAKGMTQLVQTISRVKKRINPGLKIDGMLLTLVDSRTNLAKSTVEALRENFGSQIKMYRTYIPIAVKAAETSSKGKSIFAYEPGSTVSKAYTEFTKEVLADGRKKERLHSHEAR